MKTICEKMDIIIDKVKELFWMLVTALAAVLTPVQNILILLFVAFLFNIIVGILTDVHVNKAKFNIRKAFNAITQMMFYAACVVFIDYGSRLLSEQDIGVTAVKWLTYIVVYFYLTNIFKNARQIWPRSPGIRFIYELLSTEIFNRLKELVGYKSNNI